MMMSLVFPLCTFMQRLALRLFADYRVLGRENVPPMGPLIIVANHQSNLDPSLMGACIPRKIWFLAKREMFGNPISRWFLRSYGAFPVNREGTDVQAYRWVLGQLERGQAVVVYPEGTRSNGSLRKAKSGVVRLALKSNATLLPVGVTGTERLGSVFRVFNPTGNIRVNIGQVFSLPSVEGKLNDDVLESLTDMIMQRIAELLPEKYQGVYELRSCTGPEATRHQ